MLTTIYTWLSLRMCNEPCQDGKKQISVLAQRYLFLTRLIGRMPRASELVHELHGSNKVNCKCIGRMPALLDVPDADLCKLAIRFSAYTEFLKKKLLKKILCKQEKNYFLMIYSKFWCYVN